jgi:HAD domain in Swiss Army Knife RNA repair proteins
MHAPLLLLDVDGVLSLFGFAPDRRPPGRMLLVDGLPHHLSIDAGRLAAGLAQSFELVWCTGWEDRADDHLPAALGLPRGLDHISFDATPGDGARHWKLAAIDAYAGPQRPLAWVDDGHDDSCRAWAAARSGPTLLVATDPAVGLTAEHARSLEHWAVDLRR